MGCDNNYNLSVRTDPEFRAMIPALRSEERDLLKQSLLTEGCRDPLVAWRMGNDNLLLDGHHRYDICREQGIPYTVKILDHKQILDRQAAADWIDANQLARRNLTQDQFSLLLGRRYNRQKKPHGGVRVPGGHSDHLKTAERLAKQHGVSEATVRRAGTFAASVDKLKLADPSLEKRIIDGHGPSRMTITRTAKVWTDSQASETSNDKQANPGTYKGKNRLEVLYSSTTSEWNTPRHIVDRVLSVLGSIDLDPCSNSETDPNIPAKAQYTKCKDGLRHEWTGRVYMNPPYGRELGAWVDKLHDAYRTRQVTEAIALLPARTDTQWFRALRAYPKCFVAGRLKFGDARNSAPFPSMVVYLGDRLNRFARAFMSLGDIYTCLVVDLGRSRKE